ncbi:uncharacterized protein LOC128214286 isoform X2 [Mya arenaria]|uniref:uncharacterized protein LOC128214286 isoform X2 n=1 Tax=Mya arenaria TaxID=6604 RepID=UPI0022E4E53C|nr:uncharacterized protein LOC128214286 isoform X2 [Mya arenaria]
MKTDKVKMELTLLLFLLSGTALGNWTDWHFEGQNIALNRPASQTPRIWNNQNASLAVDGYPRIGNPTDDDARCSHTAGSEAYASWTVNFDDKYYLKGVVIVNRKSRYERLRLRRFRIYGDHNSLLYESKDNSKTCHGISPNEVCNDFLFVELTPREGQMHARLTITVYANYNLVEKNAVYLTLCEVYVFSVHTKCLSLPIDNGLQLPDTYASLSVSVQCNSGYKPENKYAHCSFSGQWNTSQQCIPICHWEVENGYIENYHHHTKLTSPVLADVFVRCYPGYQLKGRFNWNTCRNSGWRFELQTCILVTCICPPLQYGSYITKHNNIVCRGYQSVSTIIVPDCNEGYYPKAVSEQTCTDRSSWKGSIPTCLSVKCNAPEMIKNGMYFLESYSDYTYNYVINFTCNTGYRLLSSIRTRKCEKNLQWTGPAPVCEIITCQKPPSNSHGYYSVAGQDQELKKDMYEFNTTVIPHCNLGYVSRSYPSIRVCNSNGLWTGANLTCEPVRCHVKPLVDSNYTLLSNRTVLHDSYIPINTVVYHECAKGYYMTSPQTTRTCQFNGSLSGSEPRCNQVSCVSTTEKVERVVTGIQIVVRGPIMYNENRNISVNDSLFLYEGGDLIVNCAANGSLVWSSTGPPKLRPVCPLISPTNGWTNHTCVSENRCEIGKSVFITCETGYKADDSTMTCTSDHTWTNVLYCQEGSGSDRQVAVVGGAAGGAGAFLVALLAAAGFVIYRRYKGIKIKTERHKGSSSQNREQPNAYSEIGATESAFVSKGDSEYVYATNSTKTMCLNNDFKEIDTALVDKTYYDFDMQERMPNTAIKIDNLYGTVLSPKHLEEMKIQFKEFPKGLTEDYYEALKFQNRPKNRYKNIYPYDATRVILQKDEQHCTDYINASLIDGYTQPGEYIAAQGPTKEILLDFWRMVWQLRIGKIIMLTKLKEDKKMKCVQYWPDEGSIEYDIFKITHRSTEPFSDFVIRKLALQKDGEDERMVYHFHFTSWPDKSVPQYASSLVHFRQKIVNAVIKDKGPDIVHCSAGVGRTGTFIALNILTEQASTVGYVDPVGCVNTLRRQRVDMVQTPDQYIFLHMALLETLMLSTSALPASEFLRVYEELLSFDKDRRKLDVQFSRMEKMSPVADECQYVSAKDVRNRNKNRYSNILPVADHMPHLTPSGKRSEPEYINAVLLPGYKKKGAFIVTQTPLEATKTDFWRLVVEHDVHTIVMMNNRSEMKEDEIYWPENGDSETYDNMTIEKTCEECEGCLRKITLDLNRFGKTRKLQQIQFEGWPDDSALPSSPRSVIHLLDAVQYWHHQSGNNPVLVHCMNGADRSGLFCVASVVLERMKIEQDVAITQVIKEMRNYREHIIPSLEQFQFVHEVVKEYILQNETYSNFTD